MGDDGSKEFEGSSDSTLIQLLGILCDAYSRNDRAAIRDFEADATDIGWLLHHRGGIEEMRRIFAKLGNTPGSRTLEMQWNGIGDWRG